MRFLNPNGLDTAKLGQALHNYPFIQSQSLEVGKGLADGHEGTRDQELSNSMKVSRVTREVVGDY